MSLDELFFMIIMLTLLLMLDACIIHFKQKWIIMIIIISVLMF